MAESQHGVFHWNELLTNEVEAAKAFYEKTLGWSFDEMPMPGFTYHIAKAGDQVVGGLMKMPDETASRHATALDGLH